MPASHLPAEPTSAPHGASSPRAFLNHFTENQRSHIANIFLGAVRHGKRTPDSVLAAVIATALGRLDQAKRWNDAEDAAKFSVITRMLIEHRDEALAFAQWALDWEAQSPEQREQTKVERGQHYRARWMREQPATQRQIDYLRTLGWEGEVTSRLEGSRLIDRLRGGYAQ